MPELDRKAASVFAGKVVRKNLVRKVKVGANVPVFVLEYLLGKYCAERASHPAINAITSLSSPRATDTMPRDGSLSLAAGRHRRAGRDHHGAGDGLGALVWR